MKPELTNNDRQRIELQSLAAAEDYVKDWPRNKLPANKVAFNNGHKAGAVYEHNYQREQQIKTFNRPGSKYYVSYDPDYKDKVFGVFNKEDLTQQGAEKMAQQLNELEVERSELVNENERLTGLLKEVEPLLFLNDGIRMRIKEVLNSLKTK